MGQFDVEAALSRPSADGRDKLASTSAKATDYWVARQGRVAQKGDDLAEPTS